MGQLSHAVLPALATDPAAHSVHVTLPLSATQPCGQRSQRFRANVGDTEGLDEGAEGLADGLVVASEGLLDGDVNGLTDGLKEGAVDGLTDGAVDGLAEGDHEGLAESASVSCRRVQDTSSAKLPLEHFTE